MSIELDKTWDSLSAEWCSMPAPIDVDVERLRRRVWWRSVGLLAGLAIEIALSAGMVMLTVVELVQRRDRAAVVWSVAVWAVLVVTWSFTLWNRRGVWRPLSESTSDYLRFSRARAHRGLRSVTFCRAMLAVMWAFYLPLLVTELRRGHITATEAWIWGFVVCYSAGILGTSVWYRNRALRELRALDALEVSIGAAA